MEQSERNSNSKSRDEKKLNRQSGTYTKTTYCKPSEQLFPNRQPLGFPNLTEYMKTYIRCVHQNILYSLTCGIFSGIMNIKLTGVEESCEHATILPSHIITTAIILISPNTLKLCCDNCNSKILSLEVCDN